MSLKKVRDEIDKLDEAIIPLLSARLKLAQSALNYKKEIYDPDREKEILDNISDSSIRNIYREILKVSKQLQQEL